jgi:NAD(P)-dependent dehydrogenase (short-subunit alcohol dehydrogenase family)
VGSAERRLRAARTFERCNAMPSVLITGANRGLGFEFARQYLADGWNVHAACRDPSSARALRELAAVSQGRVELVALDVSDAGSIRAAAATIGERPLDVLINGAGIYESPPRTIGNMDYGSWAKVLDVNTMGPMRVTEAFVGCVARSARRLVVTLSSGMGSIGDNTSGGSIAYRSSKAAVNMVMRSLTIDLAALRITCVLLNPGWVSTDMGGAQAPLTPADSVCALRRLIETLGPAQSGKFLHYDGREYQW